MLESELLIEADGLKAAVNQNSLIPEFVDPSFSFINNTASEMMVSVIRQYNQSSDNDT